jgi:hypothetical protein
VRVAQIEILQIKDIYSNHLTKFHFTTKKAAFTEYPLQKAVPRSDEGLNLRVEVGSNAGIFLEMSCQRLIVIGTYNILGRTKYWKKRWRSL